MRRGLLTATAAGSPVPRHGLPLLGAGLLVAALAALALLAAGQDAWRLLVLLVLAPLLEETVFRAGLQEALLRRWRQMPLLANLFTAAAFGLAHALARADAAAFAVALPALLVGAVYGRRGRLRECVVLHAVMNAAWLVWSTL